jgi:hypothetical protein
MKSEVMFNVKVKWFDQTGRFRRQAALQASKSFLIGL